MGRQEADGGFASRHGIASSGIKKVAATGALDGKPAALQESVLLNGFVCVLEAGWSYSVTG
jgi:hypothetical protein